MSYQVGIDLGTTFTAAAVCRHDDPTRIEVVPLGSRGAAAVASVVFVAEDGSVLIGEAAARRSVSDPHRVVREFKRRIGDATPLIVGGSRWSRKRSPPGSSVGWWTGWLSGRAAPPTTSP